MTCIDGGGGGGWRNERGLIETMPGLWQATNWTGVPCADIHPRRNAIKYRINTGVGQAVGGRRGGWGGVYRKTADWRGKYYPLGPISSACTPAFGSVLLALANRPLISAPRASLYTRRAKYIGNSTTARSDSAFGVFRRTIIARLVHCTADRSGARHSANTTAKI